MTNTEGSETGYGFVNMGVSACDDVCLKSVFILFREGGETEGARAGSGCGIAIAFKP